MNKEYQYEYNGKIYDFTIIHEMYKQQKGFIPINIEVQKILNCSPAESREILHPFEQKYRNPKTSSQPQQPSKPPVPTCPRCGSTAITAGARGVNGFLGFIGASKTVNRCANCGNTWTPRMK